MSYIKTTPAAVGAVPVSRTGAGLRAAVRPVAVIRPGAVPPLAAPLPRTGIGVRPTLAQRAPVYPSGLMINRPNPNPTPVPIVSASGRPMRVVHGSSPPPGQRGVTVTATPPKKKPAPKKPSGGGGLFAGLLSGGSAAPKKAVWVNKAKDCPKGYFIKKTVLVPPSSLKFWCWPNPVSTKKVVVRAVAARRPTVTVSGRPVTHAQGFRITARVVAGRPAANIRGPVIPVAAGIPPMTVVNTPMGPATVIPTDAGNVAVAGAVPVSPDIPVGSTVSTDAGPATVIDTPAGNVAVPESMAPPEDAWASDAEIDDLLGDTKQDVAQDAASAGDPVPPEAAEGASVTTDGPADAATPTDAAAIATDAKKGSTTTAVLLGGAALAWKFLF